MAGILMLDVRLPLNDGRELVLPRCATLEGDLGVIFDDLEAIGNVSPSADIRAT